MQTPSTSFCSLARTAVALIPSLLSYLPDNGFRIANSSEELLDLFEERYAMRQRLTGRESMDASRFSRRLRTPATRS